MKKKILIISYSYPPANVPAAQRPYSIAKYLDKNKFDVTVLTCGNQDSSLGFDTTFNEELQNVNLIKVNGFKVSKNRTVANNKKTNKTSLKGVLKKYAVKILSYFVFPDKGIFWYPKVKKYIKANKNQLKFDVIFSTSPMFTNHLVAKQVKKINANAILITDFRDFHYLANEQLKKGIKSFLNKRLELKILKNADKITFISDAMKNEYQNFYKQYQSKFYSIYNGFDSEEYLQNNSALNNKQLTIFYAGSFYKGVRDPMPLFNILEHLLKDNYITNQDLKIEIAGNFESELINDIKPLKIFNSIVFLGQLPRNEVLKKYKESHLLWLIIGNRISHYTGVPIKFYEYLASQRPIINFAPSYSEPTKIINELNLGWNFNIDKVEFNKQINQFKQIISQFKNKKLDKNIDLNKIEKYSRKNQANLLEELF